MSTNEFIAPKGISILNFWAAWHEPCTLLNKVFSELSRNYPKIYYFSINAEENDLAEVYDIESVPSFVVLEDGKVAEKLSGLDAPDLTKLIIRFNNKIAIKMDDPVIEKDITKRLQMLINSNPVMIFIKGTPQAPRCGFSRQLIELLNEQGCGYGSFDILADEQVRQGLKEYSNWPTYPQLYVDGELIGGLDIIRELISSNQFKDILPKEEDLNTRLKKLINKYPVMLFMKGSPLVPKCGFSRVLVGILQDNQIDFET